MPSSQGEEEEPNEQLLGLFKQQESCKPRYSRSTSLSRAGREPGVPARRVEFLPVSEKSKDSVAQAELFGLFFFFLSASV